MHINVAVVNKECLPTGVAYRSKVDVFSGICLFVGSGYEYG